MNTRFRTETVGPFWNPRTVPEDVLKAAIALEDYFEEQGVQNWKLGGCASRKYCEELEETLDECGERLARIEAKVQQLLRR